MPRTVPSRMAASSRYATRSVPLEEASRCSRRSSIHLTGTPVSRAARAINAMYGYMLDLMPKLPPMSGGTMKRSLFSATPSTRAVRGGMMGGARHPPRNRLPEEARLVGGGAVVARGRGAAEGEGLGEPRDAGAGDAARHAVHGEGGRHVVARDAGMRVRGADDRRVMDV